MKCLLVGLIFLSSHLVWAQTLSVGSHYPSSAFVINRQLPFFIAGDGFARIISVRITEGQENCTSVLDPFYDNTFLITCFKPSIVEADIEVLDSSGDTVDLSIDFINVFRQNDPSDPKIRHFGGGGA